MPELYLVRHAQAEAEGTARTDSHRNLTEKGLADAERLGSYLAANSLRPDLVLASSARRTQLTVQKLSAAFLPALPYKTEPKIYNATLEDLLAIIGRTDAKVRSLMLVGHNPGMHSLAMYFARMTEQLVSFPPATLCILSFDAEWSGLPRRGAELKIFHTPDVS